MGVGSVHRTTTGTRSRKSIVTDEQLEKQRDDTDRMEFKFPGGSLLFTGKNASRVYVSMGISIIIIAIGWTVANIVGAWNVSPIK